MNRIKKLYTLITLLMLLTLNVRGELLFDANFESGALANVELLERYSNTDSIDYQHYRVTNRTDSINPYKEDAHRSSRWFYFRMIGAKQRRIALSIDINDSRRAMYSYDNVEFHRFSAEESPEYNGTITKFYSRDTVYIAYYEPYALSRNEQMIKGWITKDCVTPFSLGLSAEGREQQALLITNDTHKGLIPDESGRLNLSESDKEKKIVYIHGRIHPSESPSSWALESLIERVTELGELLDKVIFYILPITNPDGVAGGYSRTNVNGVDLEGSYNYNDLTLAPEVANIKRFIMAIKESGAELSIAMNFHSQSSAKCSFWIHSAKSTSQRYNRDQKLLSILATQQNPYFEWRNMDYSHSRDRYIEGCIYRLFRGKATAITFETPYSFYRWQPSSAGWVTRSSLEVIGDRIVDAIIDKLAITTANTIYLNEPKRAKGFSRIKGDNYLYFGESALRSSVAGVQITYTDQLPAGSYRVYKWEVGRDYRNQRIGRNCWVLHSTIEHRGGALTLCATSEGEIFDMIKVVLSEKPN